VIDKGIMTKTPTRLRKPAVARPATPRPAHRPAKKSGTRNRADAAGPAHAPTAYHHGDLHDALLVAAERILERDGLPGLTLRAAAREAGVSHAAPTHHFGDLAGLVSDLAAIGFRRFGAALAGAAEGLEPASRLDAMGHAYVAFARAYPGMFTLMFRGERLNQARPALLEAMKGAADALAGAVADRSPGAAGASALTQAADTVRAWALVHGFAVLLLDGRLDEILARFPPGISVDALLAAVLLRPA
jgi:AcrR family transcriptional regulator